MSSTLIITFFSVIIFWLIFLSFLFFRMLTHYNNLVRGISSKTMKAVLDGLLQDLSVSQKDITILKQRCDTIEEDGLLHIQKVGLLRFNPFNDTGGDQSFILSLVNGKNSGIVISGLHSRSGTRWYAKRIAEGKGLEHELSDDENKALRDAKG
ncbi:MAG: DUF4446 family protein [Candidatus Levybacteria bacterium]|nr:DUF4446 family protein [Candidatus Levybacteria bacterium]